MSLINAYLRWRIRRNHQKHQAWLRRNRVIYTKPHHSCERNKTQAVT